MSYFSKADYKFVEFKKSEAKGKMYVAILENRDYPYRKVRINFGDSKMENYHDKTGLNLYPHLIHGDEKRREAYKMRHIGTLKDGFYSAGFFSYNYLW